MSFRQSGTRHVDSSNSRSSLVLLRAGGAGSGGWGRGWDSGGLEQLSPAQCFEIGPFLQKRMWGWGVSPILLFNPKQQKHKTKSERMKEKQTNKPQKKTKNPEPVHKEFPVRARLKSRKANQMSTDPG